MSGRGRPPFQDGNPEKVDDALRRIWALVEMMRDRNDQRERDSVRNASKRLAKKVATDIDASWEHLRTVYYRAEKRRAEDPAFASFADETLAGLRERRTVRGWDCYPLDLLLNL
jgi:hypothetical protein